MPDRVKDQLRAKRDDEEGYHDEDDSAHPLKTTWPSWLTLPTLRSVLLIAGAAQMTLPDAVDRYGGRARTERGRDQSCEREKDLSSGDAVHHGAQSGKTKRDDNGHGEPDRGRGDPGRA